MDDPRSSRVEKAARFVDFGSALLCWTPPLRLAGASVSVAIATADILFWNEEDKARRANAQAEAPAAVGEPTPV